MDDAFTVASEDEYRRLSSVRKMKTGRRDRVLVRL